MKSEIISLAIADVVFREDLYPRLKKDPALVQEYAGNLSVLPPIEVNQHNELIDGWHRWTAHKTAKMEVIEAKVTKTASDAEFLALACRRNATAGKQMTTEDKKSMARRLYNSGQGVTMEEIAEILSVKLETVQKKYLADVNRQLKEEREAKMLDLWLACWNQEDIADEVGVDQKTVSNFLQNLGKTDCVAKILKSANHEDVDFIGDGTDKNRGDRQVYSIWNFAKATNEVRHFGNIPPEIIDNLLYLYTQPFQVVFDPFAGGGSTIDVCRKRMRRYYVSDLTPIEARKHEIREHDITTGLPKDLPVPDFVFLDPPYWQQAKEKYSKKKTDLANIDLETFLDTIAQIAQAVKRKWTEKHSGKLALIIGPWKDDGKYLDLAFLCYQRIAKYLTPIQRVIVPYSTQVHGGAYVKQAQEKRELLYLYRDLMVFGL